MVVPNAIRGGMIMTYLVDRIEGTVRVAVIEVKTLVATEVCWSRELAEKVPVRFLAQRA